MKQPALAFFFYGLLCLAPPWPPKSFLPLSNLQPFFLDLGLLSVLPSESLEFEMMESLWEFHHPHRASSPAAGPTMCQAWRLSIRNFKHTIHPVHTARSNSPADGDRLSPPPFSSPPSSTPFFARFLLRSPFVFFSVSTGLCCAEL